MKKKITLALILLTASCLGSYFYSNRYSFFKYLPAVEENKQLRNINGKLCDFLNFFIHFFHYLIKFLVLFRQFFLYSFIFFKILLQGIW